MSSTTDQEDTKPSITNNNPPATSSTPSDKTTTTPPPLTFPPDLAAQIQPYLPPAAPPPPSSPPPRPFVTLTYAQSLDSQIAASPGAPTALSGAASKAMTHHLRGRHDAILVGVGTAAADDPGLNCRVAGGKQPRPVVLDPDARWAVSAASRMVRVAAAGEGLGPWVVVLRGGAGVAVELERRRAVVEAVGGRYLVVGSRGWGDVLGVLAREGVRSVMVEGGARVIEGLLGGRLDSVDVVDSVVVTIAPVWLGKGGVVVCPGRREGEEGLRLRDVRWVQVGEDMVLCGRVMR